MTRLVETRDAIKRWQEYVYEMLLERKAALDADPERCNKDREYMLLDTVQSSLSHAWSQIDYALPFEEQIILKEVFGYEQAREFAGRIEANSSADDEAGHVTDTVGEVCATNESGVAEALERR